MSQETMSKQVDKEVESRLSSADTKLVGKKRTKFHKAWTLIPNVSLPANLK